MAPCAVLPVLFGGAGLPAAAGVGRAPCCTDPLPAAGGDPLPAAGGGPLPAAGDDPLPAAGALPVPGFGLPAAALVVWLGFAPAAVGSFVVAAVLSTGTVCADVVRVVGVITRALAEGEIENETWCMGQLMSVWVSTDVVCLGAGVAAALLA